MHVTPSVARRFGGPAVTVVECSRALNALGVRTTIVAPDMAQTPKAAHRRRLEPSDLPLGAEHLDIRVFPVRRPHRLAFCPGLYREVARRATDYDVIHIHQLFLFPQFAGYLHARRQGIPYLVSPSGALDPYLRRRSRLVKAMTDLTWQHGMLARASALHYKTAEEAKLVADLNLRPRPVVVPNGIDWLAFQDLPDRMEFRSEHLGGHSGPLILNVGRISEKKGLDILIRSLSLLTEAFPESHLAIVGPNDEGLRPKLAALAQDLGVSTRVTFTDMLHGRSLRAALAAADVWALPSHTENFGLAIVEALAAGLPAVISPAVNIARDIADAEAGVVAELSEGAFATALARLLRDRNRREVLGRNARGFARRYDWSGIAPKWLEMYRGVVSPNRQASAAASLAGSAG